MITQERVSKLILILTLPAVQCSQQSEWMFLLTLTLSSIEGAERPHFEFNFVLYTTAAILVALDLSLLFTMYYVYAGHGTS